MNNIELKTIAYKTLVRPTREYGATVWDAYTKTNINRLNGAHISAACFILRNYERKPGTVP